MNYDVTVDQILDSIGGLDNIRNAEHCATRLRIILKDNDKANAEKAKEINEISGYFYQSGQHQFIIGSGKVSHVYDTLKRALGGEFESQDFKQDTFANLTASQKVVRTLADILIPLIPALVTTGLLMGLRGMMLHSGIEFSPELLALFSMLTDTAFAFLPVLIAYSAAKKFGGNAIIAIVVGLMMVAPQLPNAWVVANGGAEPMVVNLLGISFPLVGYQGTVLPAIFAGWFVSYLERNLRRFIPSSMDLIFTPFLTITIAVFVILFGFGPLLQNIEHGCTSLVRMALDLPMGIGYILYGAVQQMIVITGLHHALGVIEIGLLNETGLNPLQPLGTASMAGQFGAAIAVATLLKDKLKKSNAYSASISTLFGITEPLLFGVNLQYGKVFAFGMVGGAVGGLMTYLLSISATGMGITFIPGILLYSHSLSAVFGYLTVIASAFVTAFCLTRAYNPIKKA
ncbi:PTS sugar transporter subunit IIA [Photobacterium jeanii]|uniref:PTS sugar transporter subunit IIA n=1 Tax=Photobacterium jeanii TaxID=858640 RepID=A0A178K281_9GAMM|nr:PTS transporter subunit EIIC [Photobacterium jeanii]OAN11391.1 PTS sugar transporter subunit IIA [Photobacterium jeanii]PST90912.1 PTS sugar transporter subunit IIA [Photobacterium jeanii]